MRRGAAVVVAMCFALGGCHSGSRFAATCSFAGGGTAVLGLLFGPLVLVGYVAKDFFEFLSAPAPWNTDDEGSTQ